MGLRLVVMAFVYGLCALTGRKLHILMIKAAILAVSILNVAPALSGAFMPI
ncbi:hypothetical protein QW180_02810 [Vibrio sinaloensis]|nr:hypothetical protein [Vibrio sinaloensis]